MVEYMAVINLTPDSFYEPSRVWDGSAVDGSSSVGAPVVERCLQRILEFVAAGASIIDLGAVSTRPGAAPVGVAEEWRRLAPVLQALALFVAPGGRMLSGDLSFRISIDTTSSEIVRRAYDIIGPFIVNDISAGEDDPFMLPLVARLGLTCVAMHKRGTPSTMDGLCWYPGGVVEELLRYFGDFDRRASAIGLTDWILDPGLGFAKTPEQCWEILQQLPRLQALGRPILIGAADKRFTRMAPPSLSCASEDGVSGHPAAGKERTAGKLAGGGPADSMAGRVGVDAPDGLALAHKLAVRGGASILRVHNLPAL